MEFELAERYKGAAWGGEASAILRACVQCGNCEATCPTFRLVKDPWDGPRGRVVLSSQVMAGVEPAADARHHLDRCLTCRACETTCPEGVRFGRLLDIGRELVEQRWPRPLAERLIRRGLRMVLPHRQRFTALLRLGQAARRFLPAAWRTKIPDRRTGGAWPTPAHRRTMLVWQGCVQPGVAPDINAAAARVLDRFGIRLIPAKGGCCGAISHHMAAVEEARELMRRNIDACWAQIEAGAEAIVMTASGCGAHLRDYGHLLRDDPAYHDKAARVAAMTLDIAEVVAREWPSQLVVQPADPPRRIAFQSPCSLQHGQRLNGVVERLLKRAEFRLIPVDYPFMCCGSAGTYSLLQPALAESLREQKLHTLTRSRPTMIATANIGCLMHLAAASPVPVGHWIELLDDALSARRDG
jgi:glycolate oxidase iron-sulfur subunit